MENENDQMEIMRHSLAHIMAAAVKELWPNVKFAIGPAITNGFYYDFDFSDKSISDKDFLKIEKKMKEIIRQDSEFIRSEVAIDEAIAREKNNGQIYKQEMIEDLKKAGETKVSYYKLGEFKDLCRGPHVKSSGKIKDDIFKIVKLAGAYWRGNEKNKMLTRIYAYAFPGREKLDQFVNMLEEGEKRDHRKLGKELDLFILDPVVGAGLVIWQPKGALIWRIMEEFWYDEHLKNGYDLVRTPHIGSRGLWEKSGHWGFYADNMYPTLEVGQSLSEMKNGQKAPVKEEYLLKPMNCPFHVSIYNSRSRSYRDLPIRYAECGTVYRYEKSGELSGLIRVRGFTQDDAHIICAKSQIKKELKQVIDFIIYMLSTFGFKDYGVYLSVHDPKNKEKYEGNEEGWKFTERILEEVANEKKLIFKKEEGEAAFYGPKLDFKIKDCLGREWQCSTLQFDFNLPERFDMSFINKNGKKEKPYMLHRALFGSFERFIGVMIEQYAGAFPVWLSPVQVKLLSVGSAHVKFCKKLAAQFKKQNIRVEIDENNETIGNKIRKAATEKIPYILVIGDKEISSPTLCVRDRGVKDTRLVSKKDFIREIKEKIKNRN